MATNAALHVSPSSNVLEGIIKVDVDLVLTKSAARRLATLSLHFMLVLMKGSKIPLPSSMVIVESLTKQNTTISL